MRASRLLSILMLLQTRGRMSATQLAAEVEVDVRTIYRDIDDLSSSGVPVYAERGRAGGFQLLEGYRTKLTGLTRAEAEALFLTGLPGPAADLGLQESSAAARLKLLAALPVETRGAADRALNRFHLDPTPWYRDPESGPLLQVVAETVWQSRRLRVRYESWDKVVERDLEPLGLVLKAGTWYLVARADRSVRTYRVAKILEAAAKTFEDSVYRDEAVLIVTERGKKLLRSRGSAIERAVAKTAKAAGEGRWRVTIPIESVDQAKRELLSLGLEGEVVAPAPLRAAVAEEAAAVAAVYAKRRGRPSA